MNAKSQEFGFMDPMMIAEADRLRNENAPLKIFDWNRAAILISERKPQVAEAGLAGDWDHTGGVIYNGLPVHDRYTYLGSLWATPTLIMDDDEIACWLYEHECEWNEKTKWPQSALEILGII